MNEELQNVDIDGYHDRLKREADRAIEKASVDIAKGFITPQGQLTLALLKGKFCSKLSIENGNEFADHSTMCFHEGQKSVIQFIESVIELARKLK